MSVEQVRRCQVLYVSFLPIRRDILMIIPFGLINVSIALSKAVEEGRS